MSRGLRATAWILLMLAVLAVAVIVPLGALRAHGTEEFNWWVGWATVAAVPLAAGGLILMFRDRIIAGAARLARSDNGAGAQTRQRPDRGGGLDAAELIRVRAGSSSQAIGTNVGTVVHMDTVNLGPVTSDTQAEESSGAPRRGGLGGSGDTLPLRNQMFTGRREVLEGLWERLAVGPVAVRGLGGMGKSQLALEYAHRMRQAGQYRLVGWVRADSSVTITEDLAALAPLLGLPMDAAVGEIATKVVGALRSRGDWLVVYDNAQRPSDLMGMVPGGGGHVLITSRNRAWSGFATWVDLDEFSPTEAVEFLCQRTGSNELKAAGELAYELGYLPLALAQAAAYVDTRSMTIAGYLQSYRDPMQARRLRDAGLDSAEYPASVARTWLLSFMQLSAEYPAAVELLRLCAFLDPDDIDLNVLSAGREETGEFLAGVLGNQLERTEAAGALAATSLATVPAEGHLRVHRLVQAVTRDQLDDDQAAAWVKRALNLVAAILPSAPANYRSWPMYARLAPHIEAIAGHAYSYPILAERISILRDLGIYLSASGQLKAASTTFERVLAISQAAHDPGHQEIAKALGNLGGAQLRLWELRDARYSIERALSTLQEAYGPDHPEVAKALANLGAVQMWVGELRDARASIERALPIFQAAYGSDCPQSALALVNLGAVQMRQGELEDARASIERARTISEKAYGPDHPEVAAVLVNLAIVQMRLRKLEDARASIERALTVFQEAYGPDHRECATTVINLAIVQMRQGELEDARASIERALTISEKAYGPDHPEVAAVLVNLAIVQTCQGELENASASIEHALTVFQGAYGPDHPEVASALVNLGAIQMRQGELEDARASIEHGLTISEKAYGPDHPELVSALVNLSVVQMRLGKLEDACASMERGLAISEKAYGPDHHKVVKTLIDLGIVRGGKFAKYLISISLALMSDSARQNLKDQ